MREAPAPAVDGGEARPLPGARLLHPRPPAIASNESTSRGWGLAEWTVALSLLLGNPLLTLGLPAGLVFALFDRRPAARAAGVVVVAVIAATAVGSAVGIALVAVSAAMAVASATVVARGDRRLGMDGIVAPALAVAAIGLSAAFALAGKAIGRWEVELGAAFVQSAERAIAPYRALGMNAEALARMEAMLEGFARGMVAIWPAFIALSIWMGVWLALRVLGRLGRVGSDLGRRLTPRPFERFRPPELLVWPLIGALAGLWSDVGWIQRAATNAAVALAFVYAMVGLALTWWWLGRRGVGTVARLVLVALASFAAPLVAAIWLMLGLADVWLGFRERERTS